MHGPARRLTHPLLMTMPPNAALPVFCDVSLAATGARAITIEGQSIPFVGRASLEGGIYTSLSCRCMTLTSCPIAPTCVTRQLRWPSEVRTPVVKPIPERIRRI